MSRQFFPSLFGLWLLSGVLLVAGIKGCGSNEVIDETVYDKVPNANAVPSRKNYEKWRPHWNETWIVALKSSEKKLLSKPELKLKAINALLDNLSIEFGDSIRARAQLLLESNISAEVISLLKAPNLAHEPDATIVGFGRVSFTEGRGLWRNLLEIGGQTNLIDAELDKKFVFDAWQSLERVPDFAWVEPDIESQVFQAAPIPAAYTTPSELSNADLRARFDTIEAVEAYKYASENGLQSNRQVVAAVIDTGIDYLHPALKDAMFRNPSEIENGVDDDGNGYIDDVFGIDASFEPGDIDKGPLPTPGPADLNGPGRKCPQQSVGDGAKADSCGHGTHVAGIIAARPGSGHSVLGVCPSCKLYSFRSTGRVKNGGTVLNANTGISDLAQIRSLAYILNFTYGGSSILNIHIVNMSIGKYFRSRAIAFLIRSLQRNKVLVVAAAGNENTETPSYPGAFSSVLAVCATSLSTDQIESCQNPGNKRGQFGKTCFSNFGDWVDICAPGHSIISTIPGDSTKEENGTSQATPLVAGAAGYLMSIAGDVYGEAVQDLLKSYSNAEALYSTRANEPFKGIVGKNSAYFYLGSGALNLKNSTKALKNQGVKNFIAQMPNLVGQQVSNGCIVSSVAGKGVIPVWHFFMSAPFLLLSFLGVLHFKRLLVGKR